MKTLQINSNFGRFATTASVELPVELDGTFEELLCSGLENELFRTGGSAGFKAVVALGGEALPDKDGNVKPIDKKTQRSLIPYSAERAKVLAAAMNEAANKEGSKLPPIRFAVTGEYVYGEAAGSSKEAKETWAEVTKLDDEAKLEALVALGLEEDCTEEEGVAAVHRFLLEEKRKAAAAAKARMFGKKS